MMTPRLAVAADLPQLAALEASCNPHPWSQTQLQQSLEHDCIEVMHDRGQVVAMVVSKSIDDEAEIYLLNTLAAYRRQGLARHLLRRIQQRHRRIFLEVRASNLLAQHAYAALGFVHIAVRSHYYPTANGEREDALMMQWDA